MARHLSVVSLLDVLTALLPSPGSAFDWARKVTGGFPMALNDQLGDCTIAGVIHLIQIVFALLGEQFVYPGDEAVRAVYFKLTGGQDTGLDLGTVTKEWATEGLFGTKAVGVAAIHPRDIATMQLGAYNFGALYLGGDIPQSAETEFEDHDPWTLQPGRHPGIGGHCFVASGADPLTGMFPTETWGDETAFSTPWWHFYGDEVIVVVLDKMVEAGHGALASVNVNRLIEQTKVWAEAA